MRRLLACMASLPLVVLAGCTGSGSGHSATVQSGSPSGARSASTTGLTNWPTYNRTDSRSGVARASITLPLHHAWTATLDGSVYGDPLVVNGKVIVATENDSVYQLNPSSGRVIWRRHLGTPQPLDQLPCGDIDPLGITGTPAYDRKTGSVFVVAETVGGHHTLWSLNADTGHPRWHKSTDILPKRNRKAEQQRSALLVTDGRVLTTYGGLDGDCDNYDGYVTSTSVTGTGKTTHYAVPTAREAGMWSPAGPVVGQNGNVYVASGNGAEEQGRWDKSDSVTELSPVSMHRVAVFAPSSWKQDNINDRDLGSSSPVPINGRIVIAGKSGAAYLLRTSLGGVGSAIKATAMNECPAYGGAAHEGNIAIMPCINGIRALSVGKHSLHWKWTASGIYGSPVISGRRVYVADVNSATLKVLSLSTGHVIASISTVNGLNHFPSEVVDNHLILVPTTSGITAIRGSSG